MSLKKTALFSLLQPKVAKATAVTQVAVDEFSKTIFGIKTDPRPPDVKGPWTYEMDPWPQKASDGTLLATFSNISVSLVRTFDQSGLVNQVFFGLSLTVKSEGWQTLFEANDPGIPTVLVDALTAQGGAVLAEYSVPFAVPCGDPHSYVLTVNLGTANFGLFDAINFPILRPGTVGYIPCS